MKKVCHSIFHMEQLAFADPLLPDKIGDEGQIGRAHV
jgi:hypothetical protein